MQEQNPFYFCAYNSNNYDPTSETYFFDETNDLFFEQSFSNNPSNGVEEIEKVQNSFIRLKDFPVSSNPSSSCENANNASCLSPVATETNSSEDFEGAHNICLTYINQILMEDDLDGKFDVGPENPALLAAEKPFYDILDDSLPSGKSNTVADSLSDQYMNVNATTWPYDPIEYRNSHFDRNLSTNLGGTDGFLSDIQIRDLPAYQFEKGVNEGLKFLPRNENLLNGVYMPQKSENKRGKPVEPTNPGKGRKSPHDDDLDSLEGRRSKQSAVFADDALDIEMLDKVLLCSTHGVGSGVFELQEKMQNESTKASQSSQNRRKGQGRRKDASVSIDLRSLLTACAQAITTDDYRSAEAILKQLKQHSSRNGNANQRMSHYFAEGLEARLAGNGSQLYRSLVSKRIPMTEYLKAYQLYVAACPFVTISHWFVLKTIIGAIKGATRVHIVDFGINCGFQWPIFLQMLSAKVAAPPRIRITGIDTPTTGFRPTESIDQTGLRLSDYARKFNIQFEFESIASKLDAVKVEDIKVEEGELLIVNSRFQLQKIGDETVSVDSPRNKVLRTIRKLSPSLFIHGNCDGSYNAPFFATRFRQALYHYSSLFDMIEANVPRDDEERQLIEKVLFGRAILNSVACEGPERVERPETYKQFVARSLGAGFSQVALDAGMVSMIKGKMEELYNKDFSIDEDRKCLLLGWKGRILHSLSIWKPDDYAY